MGAAFSPLSLVLVALGGAVGSVLRYVISHAGLYLWWLKGVVDLWV